LVDLARLIAKLTASEIVLPDAVVRRALDAVTMPAQIGSSGAADVAAGGRGA
jgi:hypothetical protein